MPSHHTLRKKAKAKREKFIKNLNTGRFEGKFYLEWIAPDLFRYHPDPDDPFRFIRHDKDGNEIETVEPKEMETDGGSIPRIVWALPGFSPWEYGPAYMLHDWEFEAHDLAQNDPDFTFDKSFEEVNLTLAEAIWTLMNVGYLDYPKPKVRKETLVQPHPWTPWTWGILGFCNVGVLSPIAKEMWER